MFTVGEFSRLARVSKRLLRYYDEIGLGNVTAEESRDRVTGQDEIQHIRNIEARLHFLQSAEANEPFDVVLKQIPAQPVLSVRTVLASLEDGAGIFGQIMRALRREGLNKTGPKLQRI